MKAEHTAGPWLADESAYAPNQFRILASGDWLMHIQHNGRQLVEQQRKNISLVAAAPTLLEALQEIHERITGHPAYASLSDQEEEEIGGETAELSYLEKVARKAIKNAGGEIP